MASNHLNRIEYFESLLSKLIEPKEKIKFKNLHNARMSYVSKYQRSIMEGNLTEAKDTEATLSENMKSLLGLIKVGFVEKARRNILSIDKHKAAMVVMQKSVAKTVNIIKPSTVKRFDFEEIKQVAEITFGYKWEEMVSPLRNREYTESRQILFVFLQSQGFSWGKAGTFLGGRDHATGLNARTMFYNNCEVDDVYRQLASNFFTEVAAIGYYVPEYLYSNSEGFIRVGGFELIKTNKKGGVNAKLKFNLTEESNSNFDRYEGKRLVFV